MTEDWSRSIAAERADPHKKGAKPLLMEGKVGNTFARCASEEPGHC